MSSKLLRPAIGSLILAISALVTAFGADNIAGLNPSVDKYLAVRAAEFDQISAERKEQLNQIAIYVAGRIKSGQPARLTFICTHNSRRSHFGQIWAKTAATYFGLPNVETFSGGTEATAFNPRAIAALRRAGFTISSPQPVSNSNPRYLVRFHDNAPPMECFSKVYNEVPNPKTDFCAIMTCSQADKSCPIIAGASLRLALPYDDPKAFDDTSDEAQKYDERSDQIAREMLYLFSQTKERLK